MTPFCWPRHWLPAQLHDYAPTLDMPERVLMAYYMTEVDRRAEGAPPPTREPGGAVVAATKRASRSSPVERPNYSLSSSSSPRSSSGIRWPPAAPVIPAQEVSDMTLDQVLENETTRAMLLNFASSMLSDSLVMFLLGVRACRKHVEGGSSKSGTVFNREASEELLALYCTFIRRHAKEEVPLSRPLSRELRVFFEPKRRRSSTASATVVPLQIFTIEEVRAALVSNRSGRYPLLAAPCHPSGVPLPTHLPPRSSPFSSPFPPSFHRYC